MSRPPGAHLKNPSLSAGSETGQRALSSMDAERALLGAILSDVSIQGDIFAALSAAFASPLQGASPLQAASPLQGASPSPSAGLPSAGLPSAGLPSAGPFQEKRHRDIWRFMRELWDRGEMVDIVNLSSAMSDAGALPAHGGVRYLTSLVDDAAAPGNYRAYLRILRDKFMLLGLHDIGEQLQKRVVAVDGGDPLSLIKWADQRMLVLSDAGTPSSGPLRVSDILPDLVDDVEQRVQEAKAGQSISGIPTGFSDLDNQLSGLHPGQLIVIAGRPAMGKTAFAMNIAEHVATSHRSSVLEKMRKNDATAEKAENFEKNGKGPGTVLIFSMEMSANEMGLRLLSSTGSVPMSCIRNGHLSSEHWHGLATAMGLLGPSPMYIEDRALSNVDQMRVTAKRLQRESAGLDLVIVDYMQLMSGNDFRQGPPRGGNRVTEVSDISRGLKLMAKELNVPVIALSQLNRAVEQRTDKRPMMADLRESGSIEQDADVVIMLYRQEVYDKDNEEVKGQAEINVVKQRNGQIGMSRVMFDGVCTRFKNPPERF